MTTLYCYANNEITPIEKAGVPVSDLLVQRGYGIFDFLRVAYYQPLFIDDHLDRFFNSASVMRLTIPVFSWGEIYSTSQHILNANKLSYF